MPYQTNYVRLQLRLRLRRLDDYYDRNDKEEKKTTKEEKKNTTISLSYFPYYKGPHFPCLAGALSVAVHGTPTPICPQEKKLLVLRKITICLLKPYW